MSCWTRSRYRASSVFPSPLLHRRTVSSPLLRCYITFSSPKLPHCSHPHHCPRRLRTVQRQQLHSSAKTSAAPLSASARDVSFFFRPPYHDYLVNPLSSSSSHKKEREEIPVALLASSSRGETNRVRSSWWKALKDKLSKWFRSVRELCSDCFLIVIRGGEIAIVLSPLIVLAPISYISSRPWKKKKEEEEPSDNSLSSTSDPSVWRLLSNGYWWYATHSMQYLGPTFVKLCQWIATRRDLFPPVVCDRLSHLHDRGHPHSWSFTRRQLDAAFGDDYEVRGLHVDPTVIGCGSAAQIYRGTLRVAVPNNNGSAMDSLNTTTTEEAMELLPVAIKVLHPKFSEHIDRDLRFIQLMARLLNSLPLDAIRMLNLPRAVSTFGCILHRQADLRIEASNLKQFRSNFYDSDLSHEDQSLIVFPCPMEHWMHRDVLVEELVLDAIPIAEYLRDSSARGEEIRKELASPLLRAFLKMVFIDNFIHSDLHPGNVLIRTSLVDTTHSSSSFSAEVFGNWLSSLWRRKSHSHVTHLTESSSPPSLSSSSTFAQPKAGEKYKVRRSIVFLDAGIATSLSKDDQRNLLDLFRAVILNDGEHAGRLMVERAKFERCSLVPGGVDAFSSGIHELVSEFHDCRKQGLTLGAVQIGSLLLRVLDLCRVHGVEIDPSMVSVVISTLVLEGLGRSLAPSLNLIDFAVPFVLGRGRV